MARPLLILVAATVGTLIAAVLLTPGASVASRGFGLVLLTVLAGALVMAFVVRRARMRDRADELDRIDRVSNPVDRTPPVEGTDRG